MATRTAATFTNLAKVLYPRAGFTKGDVIDYYRRVAPAMLPHLAGRPISMKRLPDGVSGETFFEKRCPVGRPAWVHARSVRSTRFGSIDYCTVENVESLLWLANRAALELHAYLYRADAEDVPTMLVFDLDPGAPATLLDCLDIGVELRDLLSGLGLRCYAKTSGGKGLHVAVPLNRPDATFARTKSFAEAVARLLASYHPERVTATMARSERPGRVFIDWSQNDHGKTTVCAYSLRARELPTVSTPVDWSEIDAARRRRSADRLVFTADQALERVAKLGDLFAPVLDQRQELPDRLQPAAAAPAAPAARRPRARRTQQRRRR